MEHAGALADAQADLEAFDKLVRRRVRLALSLLHHPKVKERIPGAGTNLKRSAELLGALGALCDPVRRGARDTALSGLDLIGALAGVSNKRPSEELFKRILKLVDVSIVALQHMREIMATVPNPFPMMVTGQTIDVVLVPRIPGREEVSEVIDATQHCGATHVELADACVGELVRMCEAVEDAMGFARGVMIDAPAPPRFED